MVNNVKMIFYKNGGGVLYVSKYNFYVEQYS